MIRSWPLVSRKEKRGFLVFLLYIEVVFKSHILIVRASFEVRLIWYQKTLWSCCGNWTIHIRHVGWVLKLYFSHCRGLWAMQRKYVFGDSHYELIFGSEIQLIHYFTHPFELTCKIIYLVFVISLKMQQYPVVMCFSCLSLLHSNYIPWGGIHTPSSL